MALGTSAGLQDNLRANNDEKNKIQLDQIQNNNNNNSNEIRFDSTKSKERKYQFALLTGLALCFRRFVVIS